MPLFELANKANVNKIAKGIKILKNIGTLGFRNKLAPEGLVLPNSLIHFILILSKQYLVSICCSCFIPFISVAMFSWSKRFILFSVFSFLQALPKI